LQFGPERESEQTMTVRDLMAQLESLDPDADVIVGMNGHFSPIAAVVSAAKVPTIVLRGRGEPPARFSIGEDGLLNRLLGFSLSDAEMGAFLGRSADSVRRRLKKG